MKSTQPLPLPRLPSLALMYLVYLTLALPLGAGMVATAAAQVSAEDQLADERNTIAIAERASRSVVAVQIAGADSPQMLSQGQPGQKQGAGSGFVIDDEGRIITNFHVVAGALEDIQGEQLTLAEGVTVTVSYVGSPEDQHEVRIVGANPDVDLALLELRDPAAAPEVPALSLADSDQVQVGEKVIVIGNPFGLHSSLTTGVVSAVERERPGLVGIEIPYIQTDAAINPGNSGGPLLNSQGEVTGISNAVLGPIGTFAGIGLAVPSNLLRDNLEGLREGGLSGVAGAALNLPERPRLGLEVALSVEDYPQALRSQMALPEQGVVVTSVAPNGPAAEAGIREPQDMVAVGPYGFPAGVDVITKVEGQPIQRAIDLQKVILQRQEGDQVALEVWRDGQTREVEIELEVVPVNN